VPAVFSPATVRLRWRAAAHLLGVSASTLRDLQRRGQVACTRTPGGQDYDERVRRVLPQLEKLSGRGVESAFVLHVLICTWLGRLTPNWQTWPSQPLAAPGTRRAMLRAVRTLKNLGHDTIAGAFGDTQEARGARFYLDLALLEEMLSRGTYRSPAFQIGGPQSPGTRQREVYRRACLASLMTALTGQTKRAAAAAGLLERFDLLPAGTGRRSAWVKRRYRLDAQDLKDRLSELGTLAALLRTTFEALKEHLAPPLVEPVPRDRLLKQARRWRIPVSVYERHFRDFCRGGAAKANAEGLRAFETNLTWNSTFRGGPTKYRKLLLKGPFLDGGGGIAIEGIGLSPEASRDHRHVDRRRGAGPERKRSD
jgi:hypothetical protein